MSRHGPVIDVDALATADVSQCDHKRIQRTKGAPEPQYKCHACSQVLPSYLTRCRWCHIGAAHTMHELPEMLCRSSVASMAHEK